MKRREFAKMAGIGALAMHSFPVLSTSMTRKKKAADSLNVPLGLCNHSLRAMRPKATQLIEFAIEHKLDSVLFNTMTVLESFRDDYLKEINQLAHENEISIYLGAGSISESAIRFSNRFGDAKEILGKGISIAQKLDSPIVGVRIGNIDDRYTEGGIKPKIEEVIKVMKSMREPALEAGVKFAFENHAGDLRSEELLDLINETGTDVCGALYDPGNSVFALEDPMVAMQKLGKNILCTSSRDVMIWPSEEGATFQWTAIGEGLMDYRKFTKFFSENCRGVPIHLETISNSPRPVNYLKPEFWDGFPDLPASGITDFLKLVRRGHPIEADKTPAGMSKKEFDIQNQKSEFLKSLDYLRKECGAGIKS